jgi:hypothetical protein
MVMNRVEHARSQDLHDAIARPVPTGVRVTAGELHGSDVVLSSLGPRVERHRCRVHVILGAGARQTSSGYLVAETPGSEVDPDPDPALLVFEDVHVVIAAADCTELRAGHVAQRGPGTNISGGGRIACARHT